MKYTCFICNGPIIPERAEFLLSSGVGRENLTCVEHSTTRRIKGIYTGEVGTSEIILCDRIYDDDVRSVFVEHEKEEEKIPPPKDL